VHPVKQTENAKRRFFKFSVRFAGVYVQNNFVEAKIQKSKNPKIQKSKKSKNENQKSKTKDSKYKNPNYNASSAGVATPLQLCTLGCAFRTNRAQGSGSGSNSTVCMWQAGKKKNCPQHVWEH